MSTKLFQLDDQIAKETKLILDFTLSTLLLRDDKRFPWLILVPKLADCHCLLDLKQDQFFQFQSEIRSTMLALEKKYGNDTKFNTACIGNKVSQLHYHIIIRSKDDIAWPETVWGFGSILKYEYKILQKLLTELRNIIIDSH